MARILALWASPRTLSTAFERMMIERGDHQVFDEPFSATYYFSPERASSRFDRTVPDSRAHDVVALLHEEAGRGAVFIKDMAYHASRYLTDEDLGSFVSTFIVRDPRKALPSLHRIWPDFTAEEAGYQAQVELFGRAWTVMGCTPVVIDSDDLSRYPREMVRAWCEAVGIPFVESALSWEPGMQPQWKLWRDWYEGVARSSGFDQPSSKAPPQVEDKALQRAIEEALPLYESLRRHALKVVL